MTELKEFSAQFTAGTRYMIGVLAIYASDEADAKIAAQDVIDEMNRVSDPKEPFRLNGVTPR